MKLSDGKINLPPKLRRESSPKGQPAPKHKSLLENIDAKADERSLKLR